MSDKSGVARNTGTGTLAKILVAIGLAIMVASAIAEFISVRDAFLASEILGLALSQIGIVLWSTSTISNGIKDSCDLILKEIGGRGGGE